MKKFTKYLKENFVDKLSNENLNFKKDLLDIISDSLNSEDLDVIKPFLKSYIEGEDSEAYIEGLVNDSDIYEFYLKHIEDIDEILNENDFFDKSPSSLNIIGMYDYIVHGTKLAIDYTVENILKDL